jgi:hypothetical protein
MLLASLQNGHAARFMRSARLMARRTTAQHVLLAALLTPVGMQSAAAQSALGSEVDPLVKRYGEAAAAKGADVGGEPGVSRQELIDWFSREYRNVPVTDVDGDGFRTGFDASAALVPALRDLVSTEEIEFVTDEDLFNDAMEILAVAADDDSRSFHAMWITQQYHDQNVTNETRPDGFPPNHDRSITRGWYPPNGQHKTSDSAQWPPNHFVAASGGWDPAVHSRDESQHRWPPNHYVSASVDWPYNNPNEHEPVLSRTWPPNHLTANSRKMFPDHYQPISTYDPNSIVPRYEHITELSSTWEHGQALSRARWPDSHHREFSLSWPSSHTMRLSVHWPAGHWGRTSSLWPVGDPPTYPPDWPQNHSPVVSKKWTEPKPLPPWFPSPTHSLYDSAKKIISSIVPTATGQETIGGAPIPNVAK